MRRLALIVGLVTGVLLAGLPLAAHAQTTTTTSSTTTTTVDPAVVAGRAASSLALPTPLIVMSPDAARDQVVNLPTWLWVEPRGAQRSSRTEGPTTVDVTANIVSVRFDTGDGETLTCPAGGTPYDPSRSESSQTSTCTHTWRHSSAAAPGGTYKVTATVTWGLGWAQGALGTRQVTASTDVRVAESQSLDRPPVALPGQTIVGGEPVVSTDNAHSSGGPGKSGPGGPADKPKPPKKPSLFDRAKNALGDAAGAVGRCVGGEHTCLKVGGAILAGTAAAVGVGALCVATVGVGCVVAGIIAGGVAGGGLGGGLFCPSGHSLAGCVAKGAGLGALAVAPFVLGPETLAEMMLAGAGGGFLSTAASQLMNGDFDPKSLAINTALGAAGGAIFHGIAKLLPTAEPIDELQAARDKAIAEGRVGPDAPANHLNGAAAEEIGWQQALDQGQIGLQPPGKVTAVGPDFITYDPVADEIVVWDAKYSANSRFPQGSIPADKLGDWKDAISAAADNYSGTHAAQVQDALAAGRIVGRYFRYP